MIVLYLPDILCDETASNENPGAGLGLSIVKRILELHGSVIKVKSELDHGTTFSLSMPIGHPS